MKLSRGDMVTASLSGDLKKPRPAVVLQANEFIESHRTVLVCPLTTHTADAPLFRPMIEPSPANGLEFPSQVMVDKITPAKKTEIGEIIGKLDAFDLAKIETALINITGLRSVILPLGLM